MLGFGTHLHSMMKTFGFPQKFIFKAHKKKNHLDAIICIFYFQIV